MEGAENMTILWAITKVVGGLLAVDVAIVILFTVVAWKKSRPKVGTWQP